MRKFARKLGGGISEQGYKRVVRPRMRWQDCMYEGVQTWKKTAQYNDA